MLKSRFIILISICLGGGTKGFSQTLFDSLEHRVYFNVFKHQPDASILPFITKYFPHLADPPYTGGWTIYPPGILPPPPRHDTTKHVFVFTKHPFFKFQFREGHFVFESVDFDQGKPELVGGNWISLFFNSKTEAQVGVNEIIRIFKSANGRTFTKPVGSRQVIRIYKPGESYLSLYLFMIRDELSTNGYQVLISTYDIYSKD